MALLGSSWVNEAGARANAGDHDGAQALNNEAIALLEEYAPTWPALTTALTNRAHLQRRSGEWEDAITTEKQLLDGVRADQPSSREEIERLKSLFLTLVRSGRNEEAEQTISEAIAVSRRLALQDPAQSLTLSVLLGNQASVRGELGRYQDALTSSEEALSLREQLVLAEPSPAADEGLAMTLNNHSAVLRRLGRNADAAAASSRSVELRRRNVDHENPNSVALLANSLNSHAERLALLGDAERALAEALEARDLFAGCRLRARTPPISAPTRTRWARCSRCAAARRGGRGRDSGRAGPGGRRRRRGQSRAGELPRGSRRRLSRSAAPPTPRRPARGDAAPCVARLPRLAGSPAPALTPTGGWSGGRRADPGRLGRVTIAKLAERVRVSRRRSTRGGVEAAARREMCSPSSRSSSPVDDLAFDDPTTRSRRSAAPRARCSMAQRMRCCRRRVGVVRRGDRLLPLLTSGASAGDGGDPDRAGAGRGVPDRDRAAPPRRRDRHRGPAGAVPRRAPVGEPPTPPTTSRGTGPDAACLTRRRAS